MLYISHRLIGTLFQIEADYVDIFLEISNMKIIEYTLVYIPDIISVKIVHLQFEKQYFWA